MFWCFLECFWKKNRSKVYSCFLCYSLYVPSHKPPYRESFFFLVFFLTQGDEVQTQRFARRYLAAAVRRRGVLAICSPQTHPTVDMLVYVVTVFKWFVSFVLCWLIRLWSFGSCDSVYELPLLCSEDKVFQVRLELDEHRNLKKCVLDHCNKLTTRYSIKNNGTKAAACLYIEHTARTDSWSGDVKEVLSGW